MCPRISSIAPPNRCVTLATSLGTNATVASSWRHYRPRSRRRASLMPPTGRRGTLFTNLALWIGAPSPRVLPPQTRCRREGIGPALGHRRAGAMLLSSSLSASSRRSLRRSRPGSLAQTLTRFSWGRRSLFRWSTCPSPMLRRASSTSVRACASLTSGRSRADSRLCRPVLIEMLLSFFRGFFLHPCPFHVWD